jgi:hypothetical protein
MSDVYASESLRPRSAPRTAPRRGAVAIALVVLASTSFALFVTLFREPLPDEALAAYAARWASASDVVH